MSGSAKLTRPSPPKVVPSREKRAWFWLIGRSWPLHSAHPFGAKTKLMMRISDRNGSAIGAPPLVDWHRSLLDYDGGVGRVGAVGCVQSPGFPLFCMFWVPSSVYWNPAVPPLNPVLRPRK